MDYRLEVVQVPVSDVDRAKEFYAGQAGFKVDRAARGVAVSDVQERGRPRRAGFKFVFFDDPDGNRWAVQEIRPHEPPRSRA